MSRLAQPVILRTKAEIDAEAAVMAQWRALSRSFGSLSGKSELERWRDMYVRGLIDFATFEAGIAERLW